MRRCAAASRRAAALFFLPDGIVAVLRRIFASTGQTGPMASLDHARIASLVTSVEEQALRVAELAERLQVTEAEAASALYEAERSLHMASRSLERAARTLDD